MKNISNNCHRRACGNAMTIGIRYWWEAIRNSGGKI